MANTTDTKKQSIQSLLAIYNASVNLKVHLQLACNPMWHTFDVLNQALSDAIDNLVDRAMENWLTDAQQAITDATAANTQLGAAIKSIETDVTNTAAMVKAIGYVDQAIQIALKLLPLAA